MTEKKTETAASEKKVEAHVPAKAGMQFRTQVAQEQAPADPFEELRVAAEGIRQAAKSLADSAALIQRKVADAQRTVKLREKDYKETRDLIERIKAKAA